MDYIVEDGGSLKRIMFFVPEDNVERIVNSKIMELVTPKLGKEKADYLYICTKEILNYITAVNILRMTGINEINGKTSILLNDSYLSYVKEKAKAKKAYIEVVILNKGDGIVIEIYNTYLLPREHEEKIRNLLKKLSSGEDFGISLYSTTEYNFLASIVTIWFILKDIGVEGKYFRIGNIGDRSFVRIEVPFSENYKSVRESF